MLLIYWDFYPPLLFPMRPKVAYNTIPAPFSILPFTINGWASSVQVEQMGSNHLMQSSPNTTCLLEYHCGGSCFCQTFFPVDTKTQRFFPFSNWDGGGSERISVCTLERHTAQGSGGAQNVTLIPSIIHPPPRMTVRCFYYYYIYVFIPCLCCWQKTIMNISDSQLGSALLFQTRRKSHY